MRKIQDLWVIASFYTVSIEAMKTAALIFASDFKTKQTSQKTLKDQTAIPRSVSMCAELVLLKHLIGLNLSPKSSWFLIRTAALLQPRVPVDQSQAGAGEAGLFWSAGHWGSEHTERQRPAGGGGPGLHCTKSAIVSGLHLDKAAKTCTRMLMRGWFSCERLRV